MLKLKFRRDNHEKYWETCEALSYSEVAMFLEEIFGGTTEGRLELIIEKVKK